MDMIYGDFLHHLKCLRKYMEMGKLKRSAKMLIHVKWCVYPCC